MAKSPYTQSQIDGFNGQIEQQVINRGYSSTLGKLMAAQANHESGRYSNNAFVKYNNFGGYKYNGGKYQSGKGNAASDGGFYAAYNTIEDCVNETISWFERRQKDGFININSINTPEDYVNALLADPDHQWFTNGDNPPTKAMINDYILSMSNFSQKLKFLYKQNEAAINNIGIGLVGIGVFTLIYLKVIRKNKLA